MNKPTPTWDHYRSFLSVLREGSLSGAARVLSVTQPTVARHVGQLEAALGGVSLFTRSPHGLVPTTAAMRLLPHAEVMASAADALVRAAAGDEAALSGVVRVTASEVVGGEVLPAILRDLRARHPDLVFEIVLSNATSNLLRREADIAVRMTRPTQKALVARRAGNVMLGLHAHPDYLAVHGTPKRLEELAGHAIVGYDQDAVSARAIAASGLSLTRETFAFRTDNQLAQLAAIRAGCGIGICQVGLASRTPKLVRLLPDMVGVPLETWITMHEDLRSDQRMRLTFDHLHQAIAAYAAAT
ncbi:LysR family transcriptional regulator [Chelativorans alearense]|uniref:LysR family transcriptional regulator n=1 Tax=Chelativorans alearense TaxID=2681495 RepID=UPI0013D04F50|nr:LysR family transcriptional regulator [Chelativorans alearense]